MSDDQLLFEYHTAPWAEILSIRFNWSVHVMMYNHALEMLALYGRI